MKKKQYIVPEACIVSMERFMLNDQMSFQLGGGGGGRNDEDSWSKEDRLGYDLWGDVPEEDDHGF